MLGFNCSWSLNTVTGVRGYLKESYMLRPVSKGAFL